MTDEGLDTDEAIWFSHSTKMGLDIAEDAERRAKKRDRWINGLAMAFVGLIVAWAVLW